MHDNENRRAVQRAVAVTTSAVLQILSTQRREGEGVVIQPQLTGFSDDARLAIQASPDYFVKWYTIKSIGLGVVAAALAFMIGRATVKGRR